MSSFDNIQDIIMNSLDDTRVDRYWDLKDFDSENILITETHHHSNNQAGSSSTSTLLDFDKPSGTEEDRICNISKSPTKEQLRVSRISDPYDCFRKKQTEMSSYDIQHTINSLDDNRNDIRWGFKHFASENISKCSENRQCVSKFNQNTNNSNSKIESSRQMPTAWASPSELISFGRSTSLPLLDTGKLSEDKVFHIDTRTATKDPLQAQYHVVAERRRREKMTKRFIELSKLLPGLKKMDKASLLEDAAIYMKELQERVRVLEEETNTSSDALDQPQTTFSSTAKIMAAFFKILKSKFRSSAVLIKLLCHNDYKVVQKLLGEMEKMHLIVSDFRSIPFGSSTLVVTILAEIGSGFSCTVKDVIEQLQMVVSNLRQVYQPEGFSNLLIEQPSRTSGEISRRDNVGIKNGEIYNAEI